MAVTRFTTRFRIPRWVGSIEDVAYVLSRAATLVCERGSKAACEVTVVQPGLILQYGSVADFIDQTRPGDFKRIQYIGAAIVMIGDDAADQTLDIDVVFDTRPLLDEAIAVRVSGSDRTVVEGVRTQLREALDSGRRFPFVSGNLLAAGVGLIATASVFVLLFAGPLYETTNDVIDGWDFEPLWAMLAYAAMVAAVSLPWAALFPPFEWLDSRGRTRWDRWRRRTLRTLGALAIGVGIGVAVNAVT